MLVVGCGSRVQLSLSHVFQIACCSFTFTFFATSGDRGTYRSRRLQLATIAGMGSRSGTSNRISNLHASRCSDSPPGSTSAASTRPTGLIMSREFFDGIHQPMPSPSELSQSLRDAVKRSTERGYHRVRKQRAKAKPQQVKCVQYSKTKVCKYGDKCKFAHAS